MLRFSLGASRRRADHADHRLDAIEAALIELRAAIESVAVLGRRQTQDFAATTVAASRQFALDLQDLILDAAKAHAEALVQQTSDDTQTKFAAIRRELRTQQRTSGTARSTGERVTGSIARSDATQVDPAFYVALEDRFRGDPETIAGRQAQYLEHVRAVAEPAAPVIDLGCGRGEWLRLLAEAGIPAIGVDNNPAFVSEVGEAGYTVVDSDLLAFLSSAETRSASAITMFQVVEHLELGTLLDVLEQAARVLRPGGVLVAETPNSLNLRVGASTFWIDPTHVRPLHPELLKFCALHVGFVRVEGLFVTDLDPRYRDIEDPEVRRLAEQIDGPGDFTLLAWA